ncbi:unnamed protein product [Thlaspi arvense]|uniref:Uncharacterized protein n=1 Tax=Thlaspi arvense TaxID=13288 RepID=A0AAU9SEA3_THLAR|nr:unnamed protein product [Thlaspi arvense]
MAYNLIKISRVGPATDLAEPLIVPLKFFDLVWLKDIPTNRVNFYELIESTRDSFYSVILPKLERSLSLVLTHFLLLSGQLNKELRGQIELRALAPELPISYDSTSLLILKVALFPNQKLLHWNHTSPCGHGRHDCREISKYLGLTSVNKANARNIEFPPAKEIEEDVIRIKLKLIQENVKKQSLPVK